MIIIDNSMHVEMFKRYSGFLEDTYKQVSYWYKTPKPLSK